MDRYVELVNFEMQITNILETKLYKLMHEEKVPVIKNWYGQEGMQLIQYKHSLMKKRKVQNYKGCVHSIVQHV